MVQTVTNRAASTYENVLIVNQPLTEIIGSSFTCMVTNTLGSETSSSIQVTGPGMFAYIKKVGEATTLVVTVYFTFQDPVP